MAILTVNTLADVVDANDGVLSLREAVAQANGTAAADTIVFASALEGQTLTLTGGELVLRQDVSIDGDGNDDGAVVTLSGGGLQRIFRTEGVSTDVDLSQLNLSDGVVGGNANGGAIFHDSQSLTIENCTLSDNAANMGRGGALFAGADTQLTILDSILADNSTLSRYGAAIYALDATVDLRGVTVQRNIGSAISVRDSTMEITNSRLENNGYIFPDDDHVVDGGAIWSTGSSTSISNTTIANNMANFGGGIFSFQGDLSLENTTVAANLASDTGVSSRGGGIFFVDGSLSVVNSTITGNRVDAQHTSEGMGSGGGILMEIGVFRLANNIISGNSVVAANAIGPDVAGTITESNGHNIFGSDVVGDISGDRENVAPSSLFAAIDPETGGGLLAASGIVPLWNSATNPALSGADLLAASAFGQLGTTARPQPAGSLPDIGSIEINQPLSTTASDNNDVLTGTAVGDAINGLAGIDFIKGLGGNDTLRGGDGGDLLDGGAGNDELYGDAGIDLVFYGGATKVTVDLSLATDKATRGSETDTLYNVEGAIGSSAADSFTGNEYNNFFQGGLGKDTATGGGGRDLYDFNAVADSKAGAATRDVITDFAHLVDKIDLMGIDADATVAGNQAFRWVGTSALTGPGEVGFFTSGGITVIRASTDADAAAEFEIQLTGIKPLTAVDFYL